MHLEVRNSSITTFKQKYDMQEIPALVQDLALILVVAGIVTLVFKKLKQPLVLGYIVAGFIISPHMPITMSVVDKADIHTWADIGVMFLLFSLGLDFSFKKILKMGIAPAIAALTIVFSMMLAGVCVGKMFAWSQMNCLFLGGMLAMSSTTIIYKAFDDLGLRQQNFASLVMSVLILEDMLAIVMMVMLSAVASGESPDGKQMFNSVLSIAYFLILWFVIGLFAIPTLLRKTRALMNSETLLIVSLGLCCFMAVLSTKVGFSSAFGAFVMGSILAETIEAEKIEKIIEPVKNLFGAIFFVSVGMLVDPKILVEHALPTLVITLTIIVGQSTLGTIGYLLSGQTLKNSLRCGFSMAQIGEFAFIIASLGLSLGVISDFIYPVVVAVSVITTFLTPYMIRGAVPAYNFLEKRLPKVWLRRLDRVSSKTPQNNESNESLWKKLIVSMTVNTVIYLTLCIAIETLMLTVFLHFIRSVLPHWWANGACVLITLVLISPFLRAIIVKKNRSEEFKELWIESPKNRLPLTFTIILRTMIAMALVFYPCYYLSRFSLALLVCISIAVVLFMIWSRRLKHSSIRLERMFMQNLRSREIAAQVKGTKRPLFANKLLDRDLHIADVTVPMDSTWAGKTLSELNLGARFGVSISSIQRGERRKNIPDGTDIIFPGDLLHAIGSDEQLAKLNATIQAEVYPDDPEIEKREMKLHRIIVNETSILFGKTLITSQLRNKYNLMFVGLEEGKESLSSVSTDYSFKEGDIVWVVGEKEDIEKVKE